MRFDSAITSPRSRAFSSSSDRTSPRYSSPQSGGSSPRSRTFSSGSDRTWSLDSSPHRGDRSTLRLLGARYTTPITTPPIQEGPSHLFHRESGLGRVSILRQKIGKIGQLWCFLALLQSFKLERLSSLSRQIAVRIPLRVRKYRSIAAGARPCFDCWSIPACRRCVRAAR
jgi:hypothetical protein